MKLKIALITFCTIVIQQSLSQSAEPCPKPIILNDAKGNYIKSACQIKGAYTYEGAEKTCHNKNMELFIMDTGETYNSLSSALKKDQSLAGPVKWSDRLGLRINGKRNNDNEWVSKTKDGESKSIASNIPWTNNPQHGEPCLMLMRDTDFKITGGQCNKKLSVLCQYKSESLSFSTRSDCEPDCDCDALRKEVEKWKKIADERHFEIGEFKDSTTRLTRKIETLENQIQTLSTGDVTLVATLTEENTLLKDQIVQKSNQITTIYETINKQEKQLADLKIEVEEKNNVIIQNVVIVKNLTEEKNNADEKITILESNGIIAENLIEQLTSGASNPDFTKLFNELKNINFLLNQMNNDKDKMKQDINKLQNDKSNYKTYITNLEKKYLESANWIRQATDSVKDMNLTQEAFPTSIENFDVISCKMEDDDVCSVNNFNTIDILVNIAKVKNPNGKGINTLDIKHLVVEGQKVWFLPSNLGNLFKEVETFEITNSELKNIQNHDFDNFVNLVVLNMTQNQIGEIREVFTTTEELKKLDLSHNKIKRVSENSFVRLKELEEIYLNNNLLVALKTHIFKFNEKLQIIWLQNNQIKMINPSLINSFVGKREVDLSNNECTSMLIPNEIENFVEILKNQCSSGFDLECRYVDNYDCNAVRLDVKTRNKKIISVLGIHQTIKKNIDVTGLIIKGQTMYYVPEGIDDHFVNLKFITIHNSGLMEISTKDFHNFVYLQELTITDNVIASIEKYAFDANTRLEKIVLTGNQIRSLPEEVFARLNNLKVLLLNKNQLKTFTMNLVPCPGVIERFDVSNNLLKSIEGNLINVCLETCPFIDISYNKCIKTKYTIEPGQSRTHDEMFGTVFSRCKF